MYIWVISDKPPDGGFGWIVLLSAFTSLVCASSFFIAFSILLVHFSEEFNLPKATLAWIPALQVAIQYYLLYFKV